MKKFKLLFLLITILSVTGCEANYNLTITENEMIESVDFTYEKTKENRQLLQNYINNSYQAYYDLDNKKSNLYKKEEIETDDNIGMRLSYNYTGNNLQKSSLLDRCYYKKSIIKTENEIIINTDGKARCFYKDDDKLLDKLTINITTDLKVIEQNADKIDGNTYTWIINDNNYQDKPINMKIDLTKESGLSLFIKVLLAIIAVLIIGVSIFLTWIWIKNKRNNKL